ncbi:hypothetical protein BH11PSE14_BH11PSE14_15520 [soil metagenome]
MSQFGGHRFASRPCWLMLARLSHPRSPMQTEELSPEELSTLLTSYMPDIPGYRVIRRIGRGGMSHVYLGVQVSLDRQVAIKVMSPEALAYEKSKQRFEQEAHTIAKLEHPCIVGVHEVGRTPQGLLYYVLPYLARGHLGQRDFTQDEHRIVEVLRSLLSALEYAHTRGIVHRDVKAENVLFDNADRPLLTDFGIALTRHDTNRITTAGLAIGSGGYMAPEQARGESVDGRADLYSVGVLAFELLSGRLPFASPDPLGLALMHAQDPIPRLPPERRHWQAFIDRAMAKAPDNRFRNAQKMLASLGQIAIRERAAADIEPIPLPAPSLLAHPWTKPILSGLTGAAVLLVALWLLRLVDSSTTEPAPAPTPTPAFYTQQDAAAEATAAVEPGALAQDGAAAAPTPEPTADGGNDAATGTVDAAPPADATATAAAANEAPATAAGATALFDGVAGSATVTALDYDPSVVGARELHSASRQLDQKRLGTPAGDNAIDSVLAAKAMGAAPPDVAAGADSIISAYARILPAALKAGHDSALRSGFQRVQTFARQTDRLGAKAWSDLRSSLTAALLARLEAAYAASDPDGVKTAHTLAGTLALDPKALEPAWSRPPPLPRPGKAMPAVAGGPATVVVIAPASGRAGVAFMRREVSRSDYAAFATATGRGSARCRNRTVPISIKKRSWASPGFEQAGDHPAVCVSYDDAAAYAQWLSKRTGETWRLPTATEWRQVASYRRSGDACQDGRVGCGDEGTIGAGHGPSSPLGLTGVRGNAREWLADCVGACRQHLVAGLGWRDKAQRADPMRSSGFDASTGLDDTGFRLVREIEPAR